MAGPAAEEASVEAALRAHGDDMKKWIDRYLTSDQIKKIAEAVSGAEEHTVGEIVPVIVSKSSTIGHVKWILTGFLTVVFITLESFYLHHRGGIQSDWLLPAAFLLAYGVSIGLSRLLWFQRVLTANEDEIRQVHDRAELEFYRAQIKKTSRRTGILIFVSVMERRVVVLADEGIAAHYPQETWDEVVALLVGEFKKGKIFDGFEKAIQKCGEILQTKLPATHHNTNELANSLIIKE